MAVACLGAVGASASTMKIGIDFDDIGNGSNSYSKGGMFFYPTNPQSDTKCADDPSNTSGSANGSCLQEETQGLITNMSRPTDADALKSAIDAVNGNSGSADAQRTQLLSDAGATAQTFNLHEFYFVLVGNGLGNFISVFDTTSVGLLPPYPSSDAEFASMVATFGDYGTTGNCGSLTGFAGYKFELGQTYGGGAGCTPVVTNYNTGLVEALQINTPYVASLGMNDSIFTGVKSVTWYGLSSANNRLDCVVVSYAGSVGNTNCGLEPDGYIPLPAAGWMLIGGIGGLAALRRKKKAA